LKIAEVTCPVALYAAATSSERIALHIANGATGHRVQRQYVDEATGKPVEPEDQVKGYEAAKDEYVTLEPEDVAETVPQSDKTLEVSAFIDCKEIDEVYFDRPCYLGPSDRSAAETFALIREGLRASETVALARAVLFRRVRTVLIRPYLTGLFAFTLKFDYEVLSAGDVFAGVPETKVTDEALDLAKHIIKTKQGVFDPADFHDRYEAARAELVKAKLEGKAIEPAKPPAPRPQQDLIAALRESAGLGQNSRQPKATPDCRRAPLFPGARKKRKKAS
jgi:DNA end-binding protein Ku